MSGRAVTAWACFECSEKEEWLDGSAPACEVHAALFVVVPSSVFFWEEL